jgi:hypothetical protein
MKKSRLSSGTGFAGCGGGDVASVTSVGIFDIAWGGGGWRAWYDGIRRLKVRMSNGSDKRRCGLRTRSENIVIAEIVSMGFRHVRTFWM